MGAGDVVQRLQTARRSARAERLRARAPRYLLAAFLAITSLVGVREILAPERASAPVARAISADRAAESFALEFTRAYLSFDSRRPEERERQLRDLVPDDLAPDAGFIPRSGAQRVLWAQVAQSQEATGGGRVIVVAAQTDTDARSRYLAVPVARRRGELSLTGYPALVGPPAVSRAELAEREEVDDAALTVVARRAVGNYVAGEETNLEADLLPSAEVSLPSVPLSVRALDEVTWAGGPESGTVVVTAEAADEHGGVYTLAYEVGIEDRRGRPYVSFIETVPTSP